MAVSSTKENIFTKFGAFISKIWHSISNFFKPDNIEEVPVSSLSTYLRTHLKFIENIISHYKPGQKGGISFDAPIVQDEQNKESSVEKTKSKEKSKEVKKAKTSASQNLENLDVASSKKAASAKKSVEKQAQKQYGDLDKFTNILKGKDIDSPER